MAWKDVYELLYSNNSSLLAESFNANANCFIRKEHKCGKIFGASKSCFIACPTDDVIEPILELISEKLTKVGIEPIIAVKERAYGQDIFCTKICGKIIESRFCVVILDDTIKDSSNIPNPNVYYEYGLMTSLKKHIIPLQKEDLKLAFNIQSYDTVKYNNKNIGFELDRAIKEAIRITEQKKKIEKDITLNDKTVLRKLELAGFVLKEDNWFLNPVIEDTKFKGFGHNENDFYLYLGKIDSENDFIPYVEDLDIILYRTEKIFNELTSNLKNLEERKKHFDSEMEQEPLKRKIPTHPAIRQITENQDKINKLQTLYIGFIINPILDSTKFLEKVNQICSKYKRYKLIVNEENELIINDISIEIFDSNN